MRCPRQSERRQCDTQEKKRQQAPAAHRRSFHRDTPSRRHHECALPGSVGGGPTQRPRPLPRHPWFLGGPMFPALGDMTDRLVAIATRCYGDGSLAIMTRCNVNGRLVIVATRRKVNGPLVLGDPWVVLFDPAVT